MSAITGVIYRDTTKPASEAVVKKMADTLSHRGPHGEAYYTHANVGMGMRYQRARDPEDSHLRQVEFKTFAGTLVVVMDGELYNAAELRDYLEDKNFVCSTDEEVEILAGLYTGYGAEKMFSLIRGKFAVAIWDSVRQQLILARDPLGQKPLYVYQDGEKFLFASEIKAILAHGDIQRDIHPTAIEDYFIMGASFGTRSIYKNIRKVPSGSWQMFRPSVSREPVAGERYWQFEVRTNPNLSEEEWMERIQDTLLETVTMMKGDNIDCGAFLSGGLDSSIVVALQSRWGCESIPTFSVGFNESQFNELDFAEAISDRFGTDPFTEVIEPDAVEELNNLVQCFDEPYSDPSSLPSLLVARLASRHVTTVLSGDGGDECFAGYARQIHDMREDAVRRWIPKFLRMGLLGPMGAIWPKCDFLPRFFRFKTAFQNLARPAAEAYANTVSFCRDPLRKRLLAPLLHSVNYERSDIGEKMIEAFRSAPRGDTLAGMQTAEIRVGLPEAMVKVDRTTMSCGLEVRSPFLDTVVLQMASELPSEYKIRDGLGKWILRQIFEPQFPVRMKNRPKQGFELPTDIWLRGPLVPMFRDEVLCADSPIAEWVDTTVAQSLFDDHLARRSNHGGTLWALLVLSKWTQRWNG
ncbi:MAG: asparagine synthase (glutamine-hydrolyzing) [Planctomycetia bacterium]|nr:asparagine synthase (glutamine-hydrolyzing) [Planctomycetia bacterium]